MGTGRLKPCMHRLSLSGVVPVERKSGGGEEERKKKEKKNQPTQEESAPGLQQRRELALSPLPTEGSSLRQRAGFSDLVGEYFWGRAERRSSPEG